jgi:predicted glutamine amidotransferase
MCLIAYVPSGKVMPDDYITAAHQGNDDGIGIMSEDGIHKFLGRKALKRAKRYLKQLHEDEIEYAIHFRYATHGDVTMHNCHPHELPNGNGWLMHNGVLSDYTERATRKDSDTAIFASEITHPDAGNDNWKDYWGAVSKRIGTNKLCIMMPDNEFILVNGSYGTYRDGIWYSQTYSLPYNKHLYTGAYGGSGYRPYVTEVDKDEKTTAILSSQPDDESITGTRIYPRGGDDVGERWGNWIRKYDAVTKRAYYILPPHSERTPPASQPPENTRLKEALERRDTACATDSCGPWDAWARDRDGKDPIDADKALDKELAKHLENNCAVCYTADVPVDEDGICAECLRKEAVATEKGELLPGWSAVDEKPVRVLESCVECGAPCRSGNTDFCGEAFCIGTGFEVSKAHV